MTRIQAIKALLGATARAVVGFPLAVWIQYRRAADLAKWGPQ